MNCSAANTYDKIFADSLLFAQLVCAHPRNPHKITAAKLLFPCPIMKLTKNPKVIIYTVAPQGTAVTNMLNIQAPISPIEIA